MRLPSRAYELVGGLSCAPGEVSRNAWQAHVMKHPLGIGELARTGNKGVWNAEGWDATRPPVVDPSHQDALLLAVSQLENGGRRCELPEVRGRAGSAPGSLACQDCPSPIVNWCEKLCHEGADGPGDRYARVVDALLSPFARDQAVPLPRAGLLARLMTATRTPMALASLHVLSLGGADRDPGTAIARISRGDGVRAEFYVEAGTRLRWRTTYRQRLSGPFPTVSFLSAAPRATELTRRLSEVVWFPRPWVESYER